MSDTPETLTSAGVSKAPLMYGSWTSDTTPSDHTITCPVHVAFVFMVIDSGGTNPNLLIKHISETNETYLLDGGGTQALATSPADSSGITVTNNATGTCTILVDSVGQVASGTNQWFAIAKA